MAMHPLLTLLSTRPQLLLDHAAAYAQLGQDEMRLASAHLQRQTLLALASGLLLLLSLTLAGVACMLWGTATTQQAMQAPWALWVVPLTPAVAAAVCGWCRQRTPPAVAFEKLRAQLRADAALWREMGAR